MEDIQFEPLVKGATDTETSSIKNVLDSLDHGEYYIPDYQRDASQWGPNKKSLFIESIINNFTVPPLIVCPDYGKVDTFELVDGQQRLTTIKDFVTNSFALASETDVQYADNVRELIQGKKFKELPKSIQTRIERYKINIVKLPQNLELHLKLEIFRRINEGGVPLSAHDLRLATFSQSERVYFIRLAGIYDREGKGSSRMIRAAKEKHGLAYPWLDPEAWKQWWKDSYYAVGQTPSEMFLYYVLAKDLEAITEIISSHESQQKLKLRYDRTVTSVLDLYCARLQAEDSNEIQTPTLVTSNRLQTWFKEFEEWFNLLKSAKIPGIKALSRTKIALFIAAATQTWPDGPNSLTEDEWESIEVLLTEGPKKIQEKLDFKYPSPKGKWPGQRKQIEKTKELLAIIKKSNEDNDQ